MASARSGFRSRTATSSKNQPYMPVHEAIPEEDPPRYGDDKDDTAGLLASSDSDQGEEDGNAVKLRRRPRDSAKAKVKAKAKSKAPAPGPGAPASYVPVVRNSGDIETYLDSITEAEQGLLEADHGYDQDEDYGERYDVDAEDYEQAYGVADSDLSESDDGYSTGDMKKRKMLRRRRGPLGWRIYWYSRSWCRVLVSVIVGLVLLVLGFVSIARYRRVTPAYYVSFYLNLSISTPQYNVLTIQPMLPADHRYPTPRGGTIKSWEDSYNKAGDLVRKMSLIEKVNITTGTGWQMGLCVGNTGTSLASTYRSTRHCIHILTGWRSTMQAPRKRPNFPRSVYRMAPWVSDTPIMLAPSRPGSPPARPGTEH